MHNWDVNEEKAERYGVGVLARRHGSAAHNTRSPSKQCTSERDYKDAAAVAHSIGIELVRSALLPRWPLLLLLTLSSEWTLSKNTGTLYLPLSSSSTPQG